MAKKQTPKKAVPAAEKPVKKKSKFDKHWILQNALPIVKKYHGNITLRGLHYQLVNLGMTNDIPHYKNVVATLTQAR